MELAALSGLAAKLLHRKVSLRLRSLTEDEVRSWRAGTWRIAEEVIEGHRDRLIANRAMVLMALDAVTPEQISCELVRRRPDLALYWQDDIFFRRLEEERMVLKAFLGGSDVSVRSAE